MADHELLGPIPLEWESMTLGEACARTGGDIQTGPFGSQLHASDYVQEGVPAIMPQNLGDNRVVEDGIARITTEDAKRLDRYLVRTGDLVYSRRGDVTRRALIGEHEDGWLCGTGCLRVRLGDESGDARYASYYFGHPNVREWIIRHAHGATMPNLNSSILAACPFVIPPLDEQRAIARVLGALDDKIELNRRMSATLEAMARALFKSWFVDFEPVRAKAAGRPSGLPPALDALFPSSFEASELGEIPSGWGVGTLGDVMDVNPRRRIRRGDVATHVEMAALPTSGPHVEGWTQRAFTSGSRFARGDTLLARITPSLENGKTALVDFLDEGETGWGSTEFIVLRPKLPWPPEMGYVMARDPGFREHAIVNMTGTSGRQRVPAEAVSAYPLAVPPDAAAGAFGSIVHTWFERATCLSQQSRGLAPQRDALLPRLVSGEVRLGETRTAVGVMHE